jgi:hypothetical protein
MMCCSEPLRHGERLLIRTVRLMAGEVACVTLRRHFDLACGASGSEAYRALETFVGQLRVRGCRRIGVSVPADMRLTGDEVLMLEAFGAAQIDDYRTLDESLERLIGHSPPTALGAAVCLVAQHFAMSGLWIRADWSASGLPASGAPPIWRPIASPSASPDSRRR